MPHSVSSEGGPILVGDAEAIRGWHGIESGGSDYKRACDSIGRTDLANLSPALVAWDFGGPGTAEILRQGDSVFAVRVWPNATWDSTGCSQLLSQVTFGPALCHITISSSILVFMWATEVGSTIRSFPNVCGEPDGEFSVGGAAHFEKIDDGEYAVGAAKGELGGLPYTGIRLRKNR